MMEGYDILDRVVRNDLPKKKIRKKYTYLHEVLGRKKIELFQTMSGLKFTENSRKFMQ
jgi:hypothetical protein